MHLSYLIPFVARLSIFFFVATLAAMLDSLNPCARLGIEPAPLNQPEPLQSFLFLRATSAAHGGSQARG